nr:hypothetical protein [Pontiella sulfatireligans]
MSHEFLRGTRIDTGKHHECPKGFAQRVEVRASALRIFIRDTCEFKVRAVDATRKFGLDISVNHSD